MVWGNGSYDLSKKPPLMLVQEKERLQDEYLPGGYPTRIAANVPGVLARGHQMPVVRGTKPMIKN
jgi:hypothetical protein